jgi:predicted nucleic acid-binding protein
MAATQPVVMVASESKLSALGSVQPSTSYRHEPSSTLADATYVVAAESVQPLKMLTQLPSR